MKLNRFLRIKSSQPGQEGQDELPKREPAKPSRAIIPEEDAATAALAAVGAITPASPTNEASPAVASQEVRTVELAIVAAPAAPAKVGESNDDLMGLFGKEEVLLTHDVVSLANDMEEVDVDDLMREMQSFAQELKHISFDIDTQQQ